MNLKRKKRNKCVLCLNFYSNKEMSEEHYPAKSVGNEDIIKLDFIKMANSFMTDDLIKYSSKHENIGKSIKEIADDYFDNELSQSIYPKGRTARTLCRKCNTFLGKYDESYKKFYENDGNPSVIGGYQHQTRLNIIKSIYAKFLSVPECKEMNFDFINFLRNEKLQEYTGEWVVYCLKRDYGTDMMGLKSIDTGMLEYDEGIIFELSDEKFIFHLMNFTPHEQYRTLNRMDILEKKYELISGYDVEGGYHGLLMIQKMFESFPNVPVNEY
ncbi:hypothetical protein [Enterococcus avium]|uniref:hypothetical protein n=1 Tax=Enterococcus avium TaxID=33945 RepID=UPI0032E37918